MEDDPARGIIAAVDQAVSRKKPTTGDQALLAAGIRKMAFEAVGLRYAELFRPEAAKCRRTE
jgi:hypothetical protein